MKSDSNRTITVSKDWFDWCCNHCYGSSGYGGNLTGMRKLYWGNAFVIRCCGYLFRVSSDDFYTCAKMQRNRKII
jgi:hypothetical protein